MNGCKSGATAKSFGSQSVTHANQRKIGFMLTQNVVFCLK